MKEKKVLVAGTGMSGIGACQLLYRAGVPQILLYDGNTKRKTEDIMASLPQECHPQIILGELTEADVADVDYMVISPGISIHAPFTEVCRKKQIPIISEIELAYRFAKGRVIGITGTNGKTTTTALTGQILKDYFSSSFTVGNIGIPYTSVAMDTTEETVTVAEISSFQLEAVDTFHPVASAVLNITPDHLDRHKTMECYAETKYSITKRQTPDEICVLNYEDEWTARMVDSIPCTPFYFSSERLLEDGICLEKDAIVLRNHGVSKHVCDIDELQLLGKHNYENIMAAMALCLAVGVPLEQIVATTKAFQGVAHRIEYVKTVAGVRYYNDSKGTNPDAAIKGIQAMNRPTYLIGGGYDKGVSFDEWIQSFDGKVRKLVLIGQTAQMIADTAKRLGFHDYVIKDTFEEACEYCAEHAKDGDAVLLSPACASWGMFDNYEQRGDMFKEFVYNLKE
ncbi:MAG: UDP-N-acetylmuramoyl-L-alanine--D-glutamate ligase [Lachnospiraceae bacterium]